MNFTQMLGMYVGRTVEVFLATSFYTGELLTVGNGIFTVRPSDSSYYAYEPSSEVTILQSNVVMVRVIL